MSHQVVGVVAGGIVRDIKLPQVVVAGREVVQDVVVRPRPDPATAVGDPLLQAVVVAGDHVVEAVDGGHGHATRDACGVQKDAVVPANLAGPTALEADPFPVNVARRIKHGSIPLDASGDFHGYDF